MADAGFADTDTLLMDAAGTYEDRRTVVRSSGDGVRRPRRGRRRCMMPVSDVAATDRGHTAAEVDMQARHERDARGMVGAHCCLHVEYVNT
ncbi:hypothetical protein A6A29_14735 [Streptomyces sp. TSRI0281]|nr:hypothetical protein A6A29_14735 [Streptomyces sp. TSRI0281]